MSIIPFLPNNPFDPEQLKVLAAALDDAWDVVKRSGSTFASPRYARAAREVVAKRIVEMASRGMMDQHDLTADAVDYLAHNYKEECV